MALILSLRPGQDFYVGDERVLVGEVLGNSRLKITLPRTGRQYEINDEEAVELRERPDVFLSVGDRASPGMAKISIDAPRSIPITRGHVWRAAHEGTTP